MTLSRKLLDAASDKADAAEAAVIRAAVDAAARYADLATSLAVPRPGPWTHAHAHRHQHKHEHAHARAQSQFARALTQPAPATQMRAYTRRGRLAFPRGQANFPARSK